MDEILRNIDFENCGSFEFGKLSLLRNYARLVLHVPELLTIWRKNIDGKLIERVEQTLKYVLKYMMNSEQDDCMQGLGPNILTAKIDDQEPLNDSSSDIDEEKSGNLTKGLTVCKMLSIWT